MNYFEFYNIPVSFDVDQDHIKKEYYRLSKEYHPDFYAGESDEKQQEVLEMSTLNTNAYNTLKNADKRMEYVLKMHDMLNEGESNLPQEFLMEMMELNEEMMELEFDPDPEKTAEIIHVLEGKKEELENAVAPSLVSLEGMNADEKEAVLNSVKDYYLKRKYLLRIQERLDKFAAR